MLHNNADVRRCSYFERGLSVELDWTFVEIVFGFNRYCFGTESTSTVTTSTPLPAKTSCQRLIDLSRLETTKSCLSRTGGINGVRQHWNKRRPYRHWVLYSTANDPQPQMIPRPQMIPKMDRKWSSTASDPQSWPQMIPWKLEEWNGFYGTDYKKGLIIKKEPFSRAF